MLVVACAPPPAHPRCTVIVREHWHVIASGRALPGDCGPDDDKPDLHCRDIFEKRTYERDGRCADRELAGVERVWCLDNDDEADHWDHSDNLVLEVVATVVAAPLVLAFVYLSAGANPLKP